MLVTDGRYGDQAAMQMAALGVDGRVLVGATGAAVNDHLADLVQPFATLGFEAQHVTVRRSSAPTRRRWPRL